MRLRVAATVLVALSLSGCGAARFESTCRGALPGSPFASVDAALRAAGGRYYKRPAGDHVWSRAKDLSMKVAECVATDDGHGTIVSVAYDERDDLL